MMEAEDTVKIESGLSKWIVGFVLEKFLEGKFGIKFVDFEIQYLCLRSSGTDPNYDFHIAICGQISKCDVIKLVKGGKNEELE